MMSIREVEKKNNSAVRILFSVIVPVYEIEYDLLKQCIWSLARQNCNYAEYIIVDDGSPDACGRICDELTAEQSQIRVIHTENMGVSHARNVGIKESVGDYILFVDGDDRLPDGFLGQLQNHIDLLEEITFFNCTRGASQLVAATNEWQAQEPPSAYDLSKAVITCIDSDLGIGDAVVGSPWGKVFNSRFLKADSILFPEGIAKAQDRIFMVQALSYNPICAYIPVNGYYYLENKSSVTHRFNSQIRDVAAKTCKSMKETIIKYYCTEKRDELLRLSSVFDVVMFFNIIDLNILNLYNTHSLRSRFMFFSQVSDEYRSSYTLALQYGVPGNRILTVIKLLEKHWTVLAFIFLLLYPYARDIYHKVLHH